MRCQGNARLFTSPKHSLQYGTGGGAQLGKCCRVFRHLAGEAPQPEEFSGPFQTAHALSTSLQGQHGQAGGCLPADLDAALAPGHLLAVCLEEQRLVQAPAASSSEAAGVPP